MEHRGARWAIADVTARPAPACSRGPVVVDAFAMAGDATLSSLTGALVIQNVNIAVLAKALQQQKAVGKAAVDLVEASTPRPQGAPEPGKGSLVDVTA